MNKIVTCLALISVLLISNVYAEDSDSSKIELKDLHFVTTPNGQRNIVGKINNKTDHTVRMVKICINLIKEGNIVGKTFFMENNLKEGKDLEITAIPFPVNADTFEITETKVID